mmetsp:Transcript_105377/g.181739  ORF Transcript_105377/g.181739 Transcript_105377/m.181739 type:complete len:88 (+) Transcript_105377:240-503(+)
MYEKKGAKGRTGKAALQIYQTINPSPLHGQIVAASRLTEMSSQPWLEGRKASKSRGIMMPKVTPQLSLNDPLNARNALIVEPMLTQL